MSFYPVQVSQFDNRQMKIVWNDGREQILDTVQLRRECPCASCVDEMTGVRRVDPASISDNVRPKRVESVGQYAVKISYSDGHNTGFFSFDRLRSYLEGDA